MSPHFVKVVTYVPTTHADQLRDLIGQETGTKIGRYSHCSFSTTGEGRFLPLPGSRPFLGKTDQLTVVAETKIEATCTFERYLALVKSIRDHHPYEEPVIDVYPLLNE